MDRKRDNTCEGVTKLTFLTEMLELPNFGHMTKFTI